MYTRTIFYSLITVLLVATGLWLWLDVWQEGNIIEQKEEEMAKLEKKFSNIAHIKDSYEDIRERYKELNEKFDTLKTVIPSRDSFVDVLEDVRLIAQRYELEIISLSPILEDSFPPIKEKYKYTQKHIERLIIQLQISGDYFMIGKFLEELLEYPEIINLGSVRLETDIEPGEMLIGEIVLYAYMFLDEMRS